MSLLAIVSCLVSLGPVADRQTAAADIDRLLRGVTEIVAPGCLVGPVAVTGDSAFVVVTGRTGSSRLPILAAARYGKGRVVLAGHEGLYGSQERADQQVLAANTVAWLGADRRAPIRVLAIDHRGMAQALKPDAFQVRTGAVATLARDLRDADVLLISGARLTGAANAALVESVAAWVRAGGGYFDGVPGWGWQQLNPTLNLAEDHGGNRVTARMGLVIADGGVEPTGRTGWLADRSGLDLSHAGAALKRLEAGAGASNKAEAAQVAATLTNASAAVPASDTLLRPKLSALIAKAGPSAAPTAAQPLGLDNPVGRIACVIANSEMRRAPLERLRAHPAAATFPGAVPAEAPRVTADLSIDTGIPGWASTGLYAAPGEVVEVSIPASATGAGLGLRIGPHTDGIWHAERWSRFPEVSYATGLTAPVTRFGSPFGGLVYVTVPDGRQPGKIAVQVRNVVRAPLFVQGETPLHLWRSDIRSYPGPWAELATRKIILTVPASVVRSLDDPESLLWVWDAGMDAIADLAAIPRERSRPERICSDQQISAGYMHSGYPIMTWLDVPPVMVDRDALVTGGAKKCWGFWHELGHNHQSGHWTFEGTGEVTCNLFSLYCNERVSNELVAKSAWLDPSQRNAGVRKYFENGAKFAEWCADPALALMFYAQLQQAFGWNAFRRVFAGYQVSSPAELPRTDADKRDQFMTRFSREVGRNLGPFFEAWGIPVTEAARRQVESLPRWLPADFRNGIPFAVDGK